MSDTTPPGAQYQTLLLPARSLIALTHECQARGVGYALGAKAPEPVFKGQRLTAPPPFTAIDCSGFFRFALYACAGRVVVPDGSSNQNDWLRTGSFKHHEVTGDPQGYAAANPSDGRLRVCVCRREDGHAYGHIWFTWNGRTYESYGGHGPGSRAVVNGILEHLCDDVYVLTGPQTAQGTLLAGAGALS